MLGCTPQIRGYVVAKNPSANVDVNGMVMEQKLKRRVVFFWDQYGPYHMDRCESVGASLEPDFETIGLEVSSQSETYAWDATSEGAKFRKITLFPGLKAEQISKTKVLKKLLSVLRAERPEVMFLCNYQRFTTLIFALCGRLLGAQVVLLGDSKFDDKPRSIMREILKRAFLLPYSAGLVSGRRSADYFSWLGIREDRICHNYDSVSIERIRSYVDVPSPPDGTPFEERSFLVVARFVPKKALLSTLAAYLEYCELEKKRGSNPRQLILCGDGEERTQLEEYVETHGLDTVVFAGFVQAEEVAKWMSESLALILMSKEEQWGLVINEALAWGLPVLCSTNCGAADLLVRPDVNGYIYPCGEKHGVAQSMFRLAHDQSEWRRMVESSLMMAPLGDVSGFVKSVRQIMQLSGGECVGSP